jgi:hypothetical protein
MLTSLKHLFSFVKVFNKIVFIVLIFLDQICLQLLSGKVCGLWSENSSHSYS